MVKLFVDQGISDGQLAWTTLTVTATDEHAFPLCPEPPPATASLDGFELPYQGTEEGSHCPNMIWEATTETVLDGGNGADRSEILVSDGDVTMQVDLPNLTSPSPWMIENATVVRGGELTINRDEVEQLEIGRVLLRCAGNQGSACAFEPTFTVTADGLTAEIPPEFPSPEAEFVLEAIRNVYGGGDEEAQCGDLPGTQLSCRATATYQMTFHVEVVDEPTGGDG